MWANAGLKVRNPLVFGFYAKNCVAMPKTYDFVNIEQPCQNALDFFQGLVYLYLLEESRSPRPECLGLL